MNRFSTILLPLFFICAFTGVAQDYVQYFRLTHLSQEQFMKQLESSSATAFKEISASEWTADLDAQSYNWLTNMMDDITYKSFAREFVDHRFDEVKSIYDGDVKHIYYDIQSKRVGQHIYYYLSMYMDEALIGCTPILVNELNGNPSKLGKISGSKKEIKKIIHQVVRPNEIP